LGKPRLVLPTISVVGGEPPSPAWGIFLCGLFPMVVAGGRVARSEFTASLRAAAMRQPLIFEPTFGVKRHDKQDCF
jgi:hypothetical protein